MNELALFAGAGGGILGGKLLGWRTRCAVEIDSYARRILLARQRDGILPRFPVWDDIKTFDGKPWRGSIGVISGGFPCQDISAAGKGKGISGERSGLWSEMARIIREVEPKFVFVENSPMLTSRGLGTVLGDLAGMGFNASWGVLGANDVGAPHKRKRIWIVADSHKNNVCIQETIRPESKKFIREDASKLCKNISDSDCFWQLQQKRRIEEKRRRISNCSWWESEPTVGRVAYGVANGLDRIGALGNGQVPSVVRLAWKILTETE